MDYRPFILALIIALGDPRLSIEERYRNHGSYLIRVARAALTLYRQGFLLEDDVAQIIKEHS